MVTDKRPMTITLKLVNENESRNVLLRGLAKCRGLGVTWTSTEVWAGRAQPSAGATLCRASSASLPDSEAESSAEEVAVIPLRPGVVLRNQVTKQEIELEPFGTSLPASRLRMEAVE
jgi:hypothetical protein